MFSRDNNYNIINIILYKNIIIIFHIFKSIYYIYQASQIQLNKNKSINIFIYI